MVPTRDLKSSDSFGPETLLDPLPLGPRVGERRGHGGSTCHTDPSLPYTTPLVWDVDSVTVSNNTTPSRLPPPHCENVSFPSPGPPDHLSYLRVPLLRRRPQPPWPSTPKETGPTKDPSPCLRQGIHWGRGDRVKGRGWRGPL